MTQIEDTKYLEEQEETELEEIELDDDYEEEQEESNLDFYFDSPIEGTKEFELHQKFAIKRNYVLSRQAILDLADSCYDFCIAATDFSLFPYQKEFGLRLIQSLLLEDTEAITALFSRQSGKTEVLAVLIPPLMVLLPILAKTEGLKEDTRINKFKDGLFIGIFAPNFDTAAIMYTRACKKMTCDSMKEIVKDPEINLELPEDKKGIIKLALSNGSFCLCHSAGPNAKIEGKTYHIIILEECQGISDSKIKSEIHPMGAAVGATLIKIGTCSPIPGDFYETCTRNKQKDLENEGRKDYLQLHFEFDYKHAAFYNYRYRLYVKKEIERMGFESDEFKMKYRLFWLMETINFLTPEVIKSCGIKTKNRLQIKLEGVRKRLNFIRSSYPLTADRATDNQVASIDIGRDNTSTVVTIGKVWWENPIDFYGDKRYFIHIQNWYELSGDDHETQWPLINAFLGNFNLGSLIVDATGEGSAISDRLVKKYQGSLTKVVRFKFNAANKHNGYKVFNEELVANRFTYPAGKGAKRQVKFRKFLKQMTKLEKTYKGAYLDVRAPKTRSKTDPQFDDYPDSGMMLCWLVNKAQRMYVVEETDNPFFGKASNGRRREVRINKQRIRSSRAR
jgi:hypothetical protein